MATFDRLGFITAGDPNHYDGSGLLLKELRKRATEDPVVAERVAELEADFKEDHGVKLTEKEAVRKNMGDIFGDILSDMAPEGVVFEIRSDSRGHHNYGYFTR